MRQSLLACALLAGAGLLFFLPLVLHPSHVLYSDHSDLLAEHLPAKRFLVRSWQETGELPLWCPYQFGGMPFVHDVQVGIFYPPYWPLLLLPERHVGAALSWLIVLHVILAGWLAYAYARSRGLGQTAALVTGLGYEFAGKTLLHLLAAGQVILLGLAWLPLVLLLLERALRQSSLGWATLAGSVWALLFLGTGPQWAFYASLFTAIWTLGAALAKESSPLRALGGWVILGAWAVLVGLGLSAVQLLPTLEAATQATRSTEGEAADRIPVAWQPLTRLIGRSDEASWEDRGGVGALWLAAAALAPLLSRGRVRYETAICLLLFAFALGAVPGLQALPGFRLFRYPGRILIVAAFPLAFLAGVATQSLAEKESSSGKSRRPWMLRAWVALLIVELGFWTRGLIAVRPESELFEPAACVRWLIERGEGNGRVMDQSVTDEAGLSPLGAGAPLALTERLEALSGCNPLDVLRYKEYLQFLGGTDGPLRPFQSTFTFPVMGDYPVTEKRLLDLLGVRYLLLPTDPGLRREANRKLTCESGWRTIGVDSHPRAYCLIQGGMQELPSFTLLENVDVFPRAFVVAEARPLPERKEVLEALRQVDFRRTVFLEDWRGEDAYELDSPSFRPVSITSYQPNRVVLDAGGGTGGWLVLADVWYPGWRCTIDGVPAEVRRGNFLFRAVRLSEGTREVVFTFAPDSYRRGRITSLISLGIVGLVSLVGLLPRRRK